ncbi:hypothetical protein M0804_012548 [Polistes exclamans]|nr:hypothetical protein M0804_012548 [Polistes exclamans]
MQRLTLGTPKFEEVVPGGVEVRFIKPFTLGRPLASVQNTLTLSEGDMTDANCSSGGSGGVSNGGGGGGGVGTGGIRIGGIIISNEPRQPIDHSRRA